MSESPVLLVSVLVWRDDKALMGLRLGPPEPGSWSLPAGKLEHGESVEECARRELWEETAVRAGELTQLGFSDYQGGGERFVTLFLCGHWLSGEATLREPDRFAEWRYVDWSRPPRPLSPSVSDLRLRLGFED